MLMKLGAARSRAPAAWRLIEIEMDKQSSMFIYTLNRQKLRRRRTRLVQCQTHRQLHARAARRVQLCLRQAVGAGQVGGRQLGAGQVGAEQFGFGQGENLRSVSDRLAPVRWANLRSAADSLAPVRSAPNSSASVRSVSQSSPGLN
jgi:hypothetical protein